MLKCFNLHFLKHEANTNVAICEGAMLLWNFLCTESPARFVLYVSMVSGASVRYLVTSVTPGYLVTSQPGVNSVASVTWPQWPMVTDKHNIDYWKRTETLQIYLNYFNSKMWQSVFVLWLELVADFLNEWQIIRL